jgi:polyisoprenoid-binding protein YceI
VALLRIARGPSLAALAAASLLAAAPARAAPAAYGVRLPGDGLVVDVPYSLGTHHEHVTAVDGVVRADPETREVLSGRLRIPLAAFRSDDPKRGCHLREALGLDYARSRYPRDHVCNDRNELPGSGADAIAFPEIVVELARGGPAAGAPATGAAAAVDVEGTLTVHGVSRPTRFRVTVAAEPSRPGLLRVRGRIPVRLSDFGVQVKSAGVLFVSISVKDTVTVVLDALLEPVSRGGAAP